MWKFIEKHPHLIALLVFVAIAAFAIVNDPPKIETCRAVVIKDIQDSQAYRQHLDEMINPDYLKQLDPAKPGKDAK